MVSFRVRMKVTFAHAFGPICLTAIRTLSLGVAMALVCASRGQAQDMVQAKDPRIGAALHEISAARVQADVEKLASFGTRSTLSAQDPASIAAGHGIGAAREWIKSQFEHYAKDCGGCLEVKTDAFTQAPAERISQPTQITNVYAVMKGSDPEAAKRIVLVTGHYDSRVTDILDAKSAAPGANDDGSGTAVSLECARVLSKLRFRSTIIFLTVAGEEQGLNGSTHFAQMAKEKGWNIVAALDNDIVGGDKNAGQDPGVVRVFSEGVPVSADAKQLKQIRALGGESDSPSRELARYITQVGAAYDLGVKPLLIFRLDRFLRGGDHIAFNEQGYSAVRFTEYREDFNHQHQTLRTENGVEYGDLTKFVDFDYVAKVARLNALTLATLASAPASPANVRIVVSNLDNDSTLKWESSGGASAYAVIWRPTSNPVWEHAQNVGNVATTTLRLSKDNVIFAVQALDSAGHRSLPVVPLPEH
jgi:hypothetical protein